MDKNIIKARSYFYEFLAYPMFFYTNDEKFSRWKEQLKYLSANPLSEDSNIAFKNLDKFSREQRAEIRISPKDEPFVRELARKSGISFARAS